MPRLSIPNDEHCTPIVRKLKEGKVPKVQGSLEDARAIQLYDIRV